MWDQWWVWMVAGFSLGVLEVLAPGFIFLGFAIGAVATGLVVAVGITASLPLLLLIFALLSLAAWFALKRYFGREESEVKMWEKDINDN
jgi:membrane protein implicated in regulation of membrane protease activity